MVRKALTYEIHVSQECACQTFHTVGRIILGRLPCNYRIFTPFCLLNIPKIKLDEFSYSSFKVCEQPTHVKQQVRRKFKLFTKAI